MPELEYDYNTFVRESAMLSWVTRKKGEGFEVVYTHAEKDFPLFSALIVRERRRHEHTAVPSGER